MKLANDYEVSLAHFKFCKHIVIKENAVLQGKFAKVFQKLIVLIFIRVLQFLSKLHCQRRLFSRLYRFFYLVLSFTPDFHCLLVKNHIWINFFVRNVLFLFIFISHGSFVLFLLKIHLHMIKFTFHAARTSLMSLLIAFSASFAHNVFENEGTTLLAVFILLTFKAVVVDCLIFLLISALLRIMSIFLPFLIGLLLFFSIFFGENF